MILLPRILHLMLTGWLKCDILLINSIDEKGTVRVIFLMTAKAICDTLNEMYSDE